MIVTNYTHLLIDKKYTCNTFFNRQDIRKSRKCIFKIICLRLHEVWLWDLHHVSHFFIHIYTGCTEHF